MTTIIIKGDTNRDNTITFKAVIGTQEAGKMFIQESVIEQTTTTEQVEEDDQKEFFKNRYAHLNVAKISIIID